MIIRLLNQPGGKRRVQRSMLPWGSWYFAMIGPIAGEMPTLHGLEMLMQRRLPNQGQAAEKAGVV